jgi:nitrogenase molybdenum-iron protein alpha/beta subunit
MAEQEILERLERWAGRVAAESEELPEDLAEEELRDREAAWYADYFTLEDGWLYAGPDDPAMRERLLDEEGMSPELTERVLAKMRELAAAR